MKITKPDKAQEFVERPLDMLDSEELIKLTGDDL